MKFILRLSALILSGIMLFIGFESVMSQLPGLMERSSEMVFIIMGLSFGYYGVTGFSSMVRKK